MASDGDLFERAVARGLRKDQDALFIVRRTTLSVIVAGKRLFHGGCVIPEGRLADGLYQVTGGPSRWTLIGVDAPGEVIVEVELTLPTPLAQILALAAEGDPAGHGHP